MNLLFLVENKVNGGGNYAVFKYAEQLATFGHRVFFCSTRDPGFVKRDFASGSKSGGLRLIVRPRIARLTKGFGLLDRIWGRVYDTLSIRRLIKREGIDWILGMQRSEAVRAVRLAKGSRVQVANFVFESPAYVGERLALGSSEREAVEEGWDAFKKALVASDVVLAISEITKRAVDSWVSHQRIEVVYPGVDTAAADSAAGGSRRRQVVYIGRLASYKHVDDVVRALGRIPDPPALVVCGDGEERSSLERLAEDLGVPAHFLGWVTEDQKWQELKRSRVMLFPSPFGGLPPAEALYCGTPCVGSDVPLMREWYGDSIDYVQEHDVEGLAAATARLLDDPGYWTERSRTGSDYAAERFSWTLSAKKIEEVIANVGSPVG